MAITENLERRAWAARLERVRNDAAVMADYLIARLPSEDAMAEMDTDEYVKARRAKNAAMKYASKGR